MNKRTIIDFNYDVSGLKFPTPPKAARLLPPTPPPGVGWVPQIRSQPQQQQNLSTAASKGYSETSLIPPEPPKTARTRTSNSSSRLSRLLSTARKSKSSLASFEIIPPVPPLPADVASSFSLSSSPSSSSYSDSNSPSSDDSLIKAKKKKFRPLPPVKTSNLRGRLPNLPTVIVQDEDAPPEPRIEEHSPAPPSYRAEPLKSPSRYDSFIRTKPITPLHTPKTSASGRYIHHTRNASSTGSTSEAGQKRLPRLVTVVAVYSPNPDREDELHIKMGDTLRLMEEFKDGWCRVQPISAGSRQHNRSRSETDKCPDDGVIPQFCVEDRPDFLSRFSLSPLASATFPRPFRLGAPR